MSDFFEDEVLIENIRTLATKRIYRITLHAREEMERDFISTDELVAAISSSRAEIIEDYPEDRRGHSHLVLGWSSDNRPIHVCCAVHEETLVIITVYRPDPSKWDEQWRKRK